MNTQSPNSHALRLVQVTMGAPVPRPPIRQTRGAKDHDARPLAILSHSYWKTRFASDPGIVGKTLTSVICR